MRKKLTPAQQRVYDTIHAAHIAGKSPSVRELAAELGYSSSETVWHHMKRLAQLGYLTAANNRARSVVPTDSVTPLARLLAAWEAASDKEHLQLLDHVGSDTLFDKLKFYLDGWNCGLCGSPIEEESENA